MENIHVRAIPYFDDNYSYIIHERRDEKIAIIDCGDSNPVIDYLEDNKLKPDLVLATHSHYDHAGDIMGLVEKYPTIQVVMPAHEERLTFQGVRVKEGDNIPFGQSEFSVFSTPAHTNYCTCYLIEGNLFVGDVLFSGGCGRLFEGQPSDLEKAMDKILSFPLDTNIFVGHEYTLSNLTFATFIEPDNHDIKEYVDAAQKRIARGQFTTPTTLRLEKKINPFLRIDQPSIINSVDPDRKLSRTERLAQLRGRKDSF